MPPQQRRDDARRSVFSVVNIYLDDLDKELEQRGLPFVRYADDFVIFTKSQAAAQRVYRSVERFLSERLKLIVNHDKSSIRKTDGLEYVGYEFRGFSGQIRVSKKKLSRFVLLCRDHSASSFPSNRGISSMEFDAIIPW